MNLRKLIKITDKNSNITTKDIDVSGLAFDSRKVKKGDLFFAIKGLNSDGHDFLSEAFNKGAVAAVIEKRNLLSMDYPLVYTINTRKALGKISQIFFSNPSNKLKVIAVTGTNGKTSTVCLIREMLGGEKVAARCSTVGFSFNGYEETLKETTPDPITLARLMKMTLDGRGKYFVLEASSHGLHQLRLHGIKLYGAVFTTFAHDHLDYHKTMENYFEAKLSLFKKLSSESFAFLNWDYPSIRVCKNHTKAIVVTYRIDSSADFQISEISKENGHTKFLLSYKDKKEQLLTTYKEKFNLSNLLASISVGLTFGISLEKIKECALKPPKVPGRLEYIDEGQPFKVIVDFAHNPEGFVEVFSHLNSIKEGKIIAIFGAVGDGDKEKRPIMGEIASLEAEFTIITTDNPKREDPSIIAEEVKMGFLRLGREEGSDFIIELDRRKAIEKGLRMANKGDIVLIAGRGHETEQNIGNVMVPLDDRVVTRAILRNL